MTVFKRLPTWSQITPVFAVIVVAIYTWTITWFFWKLPSLLNYMTAGEIAAEFSYLMVTNLLESLFILCAPVLLCMVLPSKWFQQVFVIRGTALVMPGLGYLMYIAYHFQSREEYPAIFFKYWSLGLAFSALFFFVFLAGRISLLGKIVAFIADRAVIFLYVYLPLSLVSLASVIFRLVF